MTEVPPESGPIEEQAGAPAGQSAGSERPGDAMRRDFGETDLNLADDPEPAILPRWVPVLIAGVLVFLASLAVYTGLRFQTDPTSNPAARMRRMPRASSPSPPGELGPGGSLLYPGESGDAPNAHPAVSGNARAVVTGTGSSIDATVRAWARRGILLHVLPADAIVYVNDLLVGEARQFSTEAYEFAQPGSYTVRILAPGYHERTFIITADEKAKSEIALIELKLQK